MGQIGRRGNPIKNRKVGNKKIWAKAWAKRLPKRLTKKQRKAEKLEANSKPADMIASNERSPWRSRSLKALITCMQSHSNWIWLQPFSIAIKIACRAADASATTGDRVPGSFRTDQPRQWPSSSWATTATWKESELRKLASKLTFMNGADGACQEPRASRFLDLQRKRETSRSIRVEKVGAPSHYSLPFPDTDSWSTPFL